jgi:hypothetical protein
VRDRRHGLASVEVDGSHADGRIVEPETIDSARISLGSGDSFGFFTREEHAFFGDDVPTA